MFMGAPVVWTRSDARFDEVRRIACSFAGLNKAARSERFERALSHRAVQCPAMSLTPAIPPPQLRLSVAPMMDWTEKAIF